MTSEFPGPENIEPPERSRQQPQPDPFDPFPNSPNTYAPTGAMGQMPHSGPGMQPLTPPPFGGFEYAPTPTKAPAISKLAVISICCGALGLCLCGLPSIFGLGAGIVALRSGESRGLALAGTILSGLTLFIGLLFGFSKLVGNS